ncbi:MAG: SIR2 family protein [Chloroflexi bacterium]|nr:SIR2 family protein [Chloroflexota bacterium]
MNQEILQMAFAIHNNPGVYALLLGSGISRSAEIPTGWEIVQILTRRIAVASGENPVQDSIEWYRNFFGKEPRYDDLLQEIAPKPSERNAMLRKYFDKPPTPAHKAIAQLIKSGYIRVVVTTNFDRLLENALKEIGIEPDVISTDSMLIGSRPLQHSSIVIHKLHGDYRDDNFKNIAGELKEYTEPWNKQLSRIFDEYGLIVCGWSGDWDIALQTALYEAKSRRYSIFWSFYPQLSDSSNKLIKHREARSIGPIEADSLFVELQRMIEALQQFDHAHPLSAKVAVERTKKLLSDDRQIELEELVRFEVGQAYNTLISPEFYDQIQSQPNLEEVLKNCFDACEVALNMLMTMCWYGKPNQSELLKYALRQWVQKPQPQIQHSLSGLLLIYVAGIAALYRNNWFYLSAIFCNNKMWADEERFDKRPEKKWDVFDLICIRTVGRYSTQEQGLGKLIQELITPMLQAYIPSTKDIESNFDLFEALIAVIRLHQIDYSSFPQIAVMFHDSHRSLGFILEFWANGGRQGADWEPLKAGLFDGDPEKLRKALALHREHVNSPSRMYKHYIDAYNQIPT